MANPSVDANARHQLYLERLAATNANRIDPELKALAAYVRSRLAAEGGTIPSKKAMTAINRDVKRKFSGAYDKWADGTSSFLHGLTNYETKFQTTLLDKETTDDFTPVKPKNAKAQASVNNTPLMIGANGGAVSLGNMVGNFSKTHTDKATALIEAGFYSGSSTNDISASIAGTRKNKFKDGILLGTKRSATAISKTASVHVSNNVKGVVFDENTAAVRGFIITAVLDSVTSKRCRGLDGKQVANGTKFPRPPYHVNCLIGDTLVTTCSDISSVFKRRYEGEAVKLVTKSGRRITITPNHPILTATGWKAAKLIDCSDKVVTVTNGEGITHHHKNSMVAPIGDIFSALDVSCDSSFVSERPTTPEDFHGDSTDGKVGVIKVDGLVWNRAKAILVKKLKHDRLKARSRINSSLLRFCRLNFTAFLGDSTSGSNISGSGYALLLLKRIAVHPCLLLLASISCASSDAIYKLNNWRFGAVKAKMPSDTTASNTTVVCGENIRDLSLGELSGDSPNGDSTINNDSLNYLAANAELLPDLAKACLVDGIEFDDVVSVSTEIVSCHVYNLENELNWYLADGIITHNCRTVTRPWLRDDLEKAKLASRETIGAAGEEYESTKKQYYTWLKEQPSWFQDDVLGKEEGLIFRNAGLSPAEFKKATIKRDGTPLTIDEMAGKDARIADYLAQGK